jgi:hypothetical protein
MKKLDPKPIRVKTTISITKECHEGLKEASNGNGVSRIIEVLWRKFINNNNKGEE